MQRVARLAHQLARGGCAVPSRRLASSGAAGTGAGAAMPLLPLTAVSSIDGRYEAATAGLRPFLSEYGLIRRRVEVEVRWLQFLCERAPSPEVPRLSAASHKLLNHIVDGFSLNDAQRIKSVEATTRHDVKAVEYFLREKVASEKDLRQAIEFLHFACTSEDVNNLAYALNLRDARAEVLLPHMDKLVAVLTDKAEAHAEEPMLSRTHGQSATPTTVGKELANYAYRLARQRELVARTPLLGKLNGAVGNYNAHLAAFPNVPWSEWGREFVQGLGLAHNPYTTQIEPHDFVAELLDHVSRLNTVALDLSRNMWLYISLGYFRQAVVGKEVGSSTMPHKVNPIDFENAEGNYGVAIAQAHHLATKLPISRMQRDLSDSTALRTLGSVFAHSVLGYKSLLLGLSKVDVNRERLQDDLNHAWQVLAEPVQTVMRRYGLDAPYEQLKDLTRGRAIDEKGMRDFIRGVQGLPDDAKQTLLGLTPASYVGLAAQQARAVRAQIEELRRRP